MFFFKRVSESAPFGQVIKAVFPQFLLHFSIQVRNLKVKMLQYLPIFLVSSDFDDNSFVNSFYTCIYDYYGDGKSPLWQNMKNHT